ncbi:hypothetical protein [Dokdonella sp.]|uniref:hypothetical protein n=1 Tax=Dokdonella sp. TaxID=2291710 RepID=UPI0031BDE7B0|nr:DUF2079 domain-containing protein [Dokdonella sp.]
MPYFALALMWQLFTTVVASIVSHSFPAATKVAQPQYLFDYMVHWDGQWYLAIINGSYLDPNSFSPAFFPLYPLCMWFLKSITFGLVDLTLLALFFNTLLLTISLYMLSKISALLLPKINTWVLPIIFILSPVAIFQNFFYTEALFCALSFSAYFFALRRKWPAMAILLVLVTATRLPGLLIVGLCGLEYLRAHGWSLKSAFSNYNFLWFSITPIGIVGYAAYLHLVRGDFLAMIHSQRLWSYHHFDLNIFATYSKTVQAISDNLLHANSIGYVVVVSHLLPFLSIILICISSLYLVIRRVSIPLGVYGFVAAVFFFFK